MNSSRFARFSHAHFVHFSIAAALVVSMSGPVLGGMDPWDTSDTPKKPATTPATKPDKKPAPAEPDAKKKAIADQAKDVFKPTATAGGDIAPENAWTIALVVFRGENADELGRLALNKVRTEGNLPEAFSERRGEAVMIAYGRYESSDSPRAVQDIKRIQEMQVGSQKPYRDALLTPPTSGFNLGNMPQLNLVQAKAMYGDAALYTLQVAVYGRRDLPNPTQADLSEGRRAAEQAAVRLRQEGEQAFYYHGPRMSMVTIGAFNQEDFDPQTPSYKSTRLLETQKRHPYNLYNGAGIKEISKGGRLQPSNLVEIPTK
jgi:hypothetical protein